MKRVTWQGGLLSWRSRTFHVDNSFLGPVGQIGNCFKCLLQIVQIPVHLRHILQHVIRHSTCCRTVLSLNTDKRSSNTTFIIVCPYIQRLTIHMAKITSLLFVTSYLQSHHPCCMMQGCLLWFATQQKDKKEFDVCVQVHGWKHWNSVTYCWWEGEK